MKQAYRKEKINYKKFIKRYEDYKNLYNVRNHQNINEIRDVISKYGENAKIPFRWYPNDSRRYDELY